MCKMKAMMGESVGDKCEDVLDALDDYAKAMVDEKFGDIVYKHVPLSVFTGVFTWITWPIKYFVYLFDPMSVKSAYKMPMMMDGNKTGMPPKDGMQQPKS